jgi:hypothetical protein
MKTTIEEPEIISIDEKFKDKIDKLKKIHEEDPDHFISKLEAKELLILAILLAIKNKKNPIKSNKKAQLTRTEYLKEEDRSILQSIIFHHTKDIKILFPENYTLFYETSERLANAGMKDLIDLLENFKELENLTLIEAKHFQNKKSK